jgi:hypothetical protein
VRTSYRHFFEELHADPETIDTLSWLIAREELLSTGWMSLSEGSVSHDQSASDAMLLQETDTSLRALLTHEDFALLQKYRKSLPTRELLQPVVARLESAGMPPSKAQMERAVEDVQSWSSGLVDRAREDGSNEVMSCEQADAFMNGRDAQLLAILSRSLDERQASVARAYYRELIEQREKRLGDRTRADTAPCTINHF